MSSQVTTDTKTKTEKTTEATLPGDKDQLRHERRSENIASDAVAGISSAFTGLTSTFFSMIGHNKAVFKEGMTENATTIAATRELQQALNQWLKLSGTTLKDPSTGQDLKELEVNGKYDERTIRAVMMLQNSYRINNDGSVEKNTDPSRGLVVDGKAGIRTTYVLQSVLKQLDPQNKDKYHPISFQQLVESTEGAFDKSHASNGNLAGISDDPEEAAEAKTKGEPYGMNQPVTRTRGKTMVADGTVYHRANTALEGGFYTALGQNNLLYTVEQFTQGKAPWVSTAVDRNGPIKLGQFFYAELPGKGRILCRAEDTGGAIKQKNAKDGHVRIDFCLDDDARNESMGKFNAGIELVTGEEQQQLAAKARKLRGVGG